jgi:hypothetical protein
MRFMMIVKADRDYEAGAPPNPELMAAIGRHTEDMIKAGVVLETGGLLPSFAGARVAVTRGNLAVTDGPFAETKELIGGYAIVQADSKDHAIELGKQFMKLHAEILGPSYEGELEIRQLVDYVAGGGCALHEQHSAQTVRAAEGV